MSIDEQGTAGFAEAAKAIEAGHAEARAEAAPEFPGHVSPLE